MKDISHDPTTHYICANCEKLFPDRHSGTVILTGFKNVRLIGKQNECIAVTAFINDKAERPEHRRSPRFCSITCLNSKMNSIARLVKSKYNGE